jgi:hypothetical protein
MYCINPECPDFVETGQHPEFVPGVTVCPKCGEYLADAIPHDSGPPAETHATNDVELEPVFQCWDPTEIPIVKSMFDASGIPYAVEGEERFDALRGGRSSLRFNPRGGSVFFLVPVRLAENARALLTELESDEQDPLD